MIWLFYNDQNFFDRSVCLYPIYRSQVTVFVEGPLGEFLKNHMHIKGAESFNIERAHRTGAKNVMAVNKNPRPIHAKFLNWKDKEKVLREAAKTLKK